MIPAGLTKRQREILDYIEGYSATHRYAPSFDEIAGALGIASKSNVHRFVRQLAERGHLTFIPARARSIVVVRHNEAA